jgi:UDP-N-acetylmuramate dehydrogenase
VPTPVRLADFTTLRLGGPAPELVTVASAAELSEAMLTFGDQALVLGGGSNLVVADEGISMPVVRIAIPGIDIGPDCGDGTVPVTIGAGENWDGVVERLVGQGLTGLAPLSGIPGSSGATPIQNVGAYGTEIGELLTAVTIYDRATRTVRRIGVDQLRLAYRSSALRGTDSAVITDITLALRRGAGIVKYAELAKALGVSVGETAPEKEIRQAVIGLRRGKGMVIDNGAADPDTRSAGSFFTNPILDPTSAARTDAAIRARIGSEAKYPRYPAGRDQAGGELVKLSAAWLIESAGFQKGFEGPGGRVRVSTKHTLALTNRNGTTADLLALARQIRDGVRDAFDVTLHPEPVFVGVALDD